MSGAATSMELDHSPPLVVDTMLLTMKLNHIAPAIGRRQREELRRLTRIEEHQLAVA
jgi:hypothetical protein